MRITGGQRLVLLMLLLTIVLSAISVWHNIYLIFEVNVKPCVIKQPRNPCKDVKLSDNVVLSIIYPSSKFKATTNETGTTPYC